MRISSNTIFDSNVAALNQQQARLLQTQQQIASGRRILAASDDPVAATRILDITQSDAINTQYAINRREARHTLSLAESTLQSVTSLIHDVRTATVNAGNGSLNNSDRKTIASDFTGRLQELIGLANSTDGAGNYLFAGFQSRTLPFAGTAAGVGYFGDDGQRLVQVSASRQIDSTNSGADVFMRVKNGNGTFIAQAASTNTGSGIVSSGSVSNPALLTGDSYTLAFAGPTAQAAGANTGNGVISTPTVVAPASVTGNDYSIAFSVVLGVTTYDVTNTTTGLPVSGMTAQPYVSGQAIIFDGLQFNIKDTPLPPANGDTFTVSSPGYIVTNSTTLATVLPVPPVTGRVPYISGQTISFDGMQVDIQGTPASGDSFSISPSVNESIFKTVADLIAALNAPAAGASLTNSLNRGLNHLDNALNNVLTTRSSLGLRLNEVDALQVTGEDLGLQLKQTLSGLQDVDYNQSISDLTLQQTTLQAAQKSFVKVSDLSLFDYI
ncbi:MAG: flagellar hook-associated protein 3 [Gallionellales bacterium RBG_16_57_15]|nr:MAG: flagellar hook-associated protein 3 [Gallionellales bacterium RBG_16_57_15]